MFCRFGIGNIVFHALSEHNIGLDVFHFSVYPYFPGDDDVRLSRCDAQSRHRRRGGRQVRRRSRPRPVRKENAGRIAVNLKKKRQGAKAQRRQGIALWVLEVHRSLALYAKERYFGRGQRPIRKRVTNGFSPSLALRLCVFALSLFLNSPVCPWPE